MSSRANNMLASVVVGMLCVVAGCVLTQAAYTAQSVEQEEVEPLALLEEAEIISALEGVGLTEIVLAQDNDQERAACLLNNGQYRSFSALGNDGKPTIGNVCVEVKHPSDEVS